MTRENLFRGFSTDSNQWVYGFYREYPIYQRCGQCLDHINYFIDLVSGGSEFVKPETVGQFTGLYSASHSFIERPNERAYFGDIIKFVTTDGTVLIKELSWSNELCCVMVGNIPYNKLYESGFIQPSKLEFEIIGNVHDNPELLKTE